MRGGIRVERRCDACVRTWGRWWRRAGFSTPPAIPGGCEKVISIRIKLLRAAVLQLTGWELFPDNKLMKWEGCGVQLFQEKNSKYFNICIMGDRLLCRNFHFKIE